MEDDVKRKSQLLQDLERELDTARAECTAQLDANRIATATHEAELLLLREQVAEARQSYEQQLKLFNQVSEELAEIKGQYDLLNWDFQRARSDLQDQKAQTLSVQDELDRVKAHSDAKLNDVDDYLSRIAIAHEREAEDALLAMCKSLEDCEGEAKMVSELRQTLALRDDQMISLRTDLARAQHEGAVSRSEKEQSEHRHADELALLKEEKDDLMKARTNADQINEKLQEQLDQMVNERRKELKKMEEKGYSGLRIRHLVILVLLSLSP